MKHIADKLQHSKLQNLCMYIAVATKNQTIATIDNIDTLDYDFVLSCVVKCMQMKNSFTKKGLAQVHQMYEKMIVL